MSAPTQDIVHQGWLWKSPPAKVIFRPKRWSRRWFILKTGSYPQQYILEYFHDESARRSKRSINLDECEQICGPLSVQDRHHRYAFHLRTPSRTYYLAANTEADMKGWIQALCQVCGLKIMEDDSDGVVYAKPSNENSTPVVNEPPESHNESDGSSPTPSNKSPSGPYIPISECFTGKPIHYNTNGNEEVTYYNVTSFPFPPKVNWATYPSIRDDGSGPKEVSYAPPRPPKKNSSKPTTPTSVTTQTKPSCSPKSPDDSQNNVGHSAGVYENLEENSETSSTSPSLQSPPGSAGGSLYCNIPDTTENKTAGALQQPSLSPTPSSPSGSSPSAIPPKVDRNLKPEVKKANEFNSALRNHSASCAVHSQSRHGCMTLPNKSSQNNFYGGYYPGPEIDRTRKPSDGHLTLSSTPAQLKSQSAAQNNSKTSTNVRMSSTSTLPNSSRNRRAGPLISPHDKRSPGFHEHDMGQELSGTYMQIDCKAIKETEARSQTLKLPSSKKGSIVPAHEGSVEYRLIDHVKTKALNQMRQDREKQLQVNTPRH